MRHVHSTDACCLFALGKNYTSSVHGKNLSGLFCSHYDEIKMKLHWKLIVLNKTKLGLELEKVTAGSGSCYTFVFIGKKGTDMTQDRDIFRKNPLHYFWNESVLRLVLLHRGGSRAVVGLYFNVINASAAPSLPPAHLRNMVKWRWRREVLEAKLMSLHMACSRCKTSCTE